MEVHEINEAPTGVAALAEATRTAATTGRMRVQVINPGWGSSGYYSEALLKQASEDKIWPAGTHMYVDHPTEDEAYSRPERTVKDLAAVLESDATWDEGLKALVADAKVFSSWRAPLSEMAEAQAIGVSIRGSAEGEIGEAEGRTGRIFSRLTHGESVDFVTHAGRGGKVLSVLESARVNDRAIEHGVDEATVNDRREALSRVVRDATPTDSWRYLRDFDESTVWYEQDDKLFQQSFSSEDGLPAALVGDPVEVVARTVYVPVNAPATESAIAEASAPEPTDLPVNPAGEPTTQESTKEDTMPQIEEARLRQLEEASGRVPTLESERDTAVRENGELKRRLAVAEARDYAREFSTKLVQTANPQLDGIAVNRIVAEATREIPLNDELRLDTDALSVTVESVRKAEETYLARLAESSGIGSVRGIGTPQTVAPVTEADVDQAVARAMGRKVS